MEKTSIKKKSVGVSLVIRHFQRIRDVRCVQTAMLTIEIFETIRDTENVILEKNSTIIKII